MFELNKFITNYNLLIQIALAILNLILVSFLTYKGYALQKRTHTFELYSLLQHEVISCTNKISTSISQFEERASTNSLYLRTLFDNNAGAEDEGLAKYSLEKFNEIIKELKKSKNFLVDYNNTLITKKNKINVIEESLKEISLLKNYLNNNDPHIFYETTMFGPESHWVDYEPRFDSSIKGTEEIINGIFDKVKALT